MCPVPRTVRLYGFTVQDTSLADTLHRERLRVYGGFKPSVLSLTVKGVPRWCDRFGQCGIKVSFWGSGTLKTA